MRNWDWDKDAPWDRSCRDRCDMRAASGNLECGLRAVLRGSVLELPNLDEAEKIGQHQFGAVVLIGPIRMKAIRAAAHIGIDQRCLQIVFAQKPGESPPCACWPLRAVVGPRRCEAGGNRCRRLDRLLIECFGRLAELAEALGSDRPEAARMAPSAATSASAAIAGQPRHRRRRVARPVWIIACDRRALS